MNIIQSPSKNFYGRSGYAPELLIVHCTDGTYPGDLNWLRGIDPSSQVSSHYYIAPNGDIHRLVDDANAAWHAGTVDKPTARILKKTGAGAIVNPNLYSIGIEVSLKPPAEPQAAQWNALKELIRSLADAYAIPQDRDHIIGHHEIRAAKTCPSPIDVDRLVRELPPQAAPVSPAPDKETIKKQIIELVGKL